LLTIPAYGLFVKVKECFDHHKKAYGDTIMNLSQFLMISDLENNKAVLKAAMAETIAEAEAKAEAKGIAEGIAKGIANIEAAKAESEAKLREEIARNLLKDRVSVEIVMNSTGLTREELQLIQKEIDAEAKK
jgi:predicted transposase YdaD